MLDFKELSKDGNGLELLIREILLVKGYKVQWSGKGADGGKDLICFEERASEFLPDKKAWLIQCKHKAHSGTSIGIKDLDDIVDSCNQHEAKGYLLVCSTFPSSTVINRLEGINNNPKNDINATYWDATIIEQTLSTPSLWKIAQTFFPVSSKNASWQIYATERPNQWIVNYKGYHFHLSNRISSKGNYHFSSIRTRIDDIEKIKLKKGHFIRIRAVYYDDKNGGYSWFLDYMHPEDEEPVTSSIAIAKRLGDGYALEDGQIYSFDVITRPYFEDSDHYDKDHYRYYEPFLSNFRSGMNREIYDDIRRVSIKMWYNQDDENKKERYSAYNTFVERLKTIPNIRLIRSVNASIEDLDKFVKLRNWVELIVDLDLETDHFFSAWFLLDVQECEKDFLKMMTYFPQEMDCNFRLTKAYIYTPNDEGAELDEDDNSLFELSIRIHPCAVHTSSIGRKLINTYFQKAIISIEKYLKDKE